jgi:hypoxanthine phosphoribosyltransferase
MIEVILGIVIGGSIVAPILHVMYVYSVQTEAEVLNEELHQAWDEIRRLRNQVAMHIGKTP